MLADFPYSENYPVRVCGGPRPLAVASLCSDKVENRTRHQKLLELSCGQAEPPLCVQGAAELLSWMSFVPSLTTCRSKGPIFRLAINLSLSHKAIEARWSFARPAIEA